MIIKKELKINRICLLSDIKSEFLKDNKAKEIQDEIIKHA